MNSERQVQLSNLKLPTGESQLASDVCLKCIEDQGSQCGS